MPISSACFFSSFLFSLFFSTFSTCDWSKDWCFAEKFIATDSLVTFFQFFFFYFFDYFCCILHFASFFFLIFCVFFLSFFCFVAEPNFVGSFDIGEYVYFFFRETAVEYINCGKAVYSRIARVCKKDTGGKNILSQNWATYLKARLNCSISGEFPFYFNEIQAVYQLPNDKTKFYATFATSTNGLVGSAVCSFDINEVHAAFAGKCMMRSTNTNKQ